jgi:hypothetical protein
MQAKYPSNYARSFVVLKTGWTGISKTLKDFSGTNGK